MKKLLTAALLAVSLLGLLEPAPAQAGNGDLLILQLETTGSGGAGRGGMQYVTVTSSSNALLFTGTDGKPHAGATGPFGITLPGLIISGTMPSPSLGTLGVSGTLPMFFNGAVWKQITTN